MIKVEIITRLNYFNNFMDEETKEPRTILRIQRGRLMENYELDEDEQEELADLLWSRYI